MTKRNKRLGKSTNKSNVFYTSKPPQLPSKIDYTSTLVNPFDEKAQGTKIHDANASRTFTYQVRQLQSLAVNNNGVVATQIYPCLAINIKGINAQDASISSIGVIPASGAGFSTGSVPGYTALAAAAYRYRIVSWGVRLISEVDALNAKGTILIREMEENAMDDDNDLTLLSDNYMNVPHTHDMDLTIIPNHIAEHYQEFKDPALSYNTEDTSTGLEHGWRSVCILGTGFTPSGTANTQVGVLQAEIVYNLEIIPEVDGIGARMTTPAAPHSNETLEHVHNTRTNLPLVVKTPTLWQKVKSFAGKALTSVGEYALDRLTGGVSSYLTGLVAPRPKQLHGAYPMLTNG